MLVLAGIEFEIVGEGHQRPMLCFIAPNSPGVSYRIEADLATANRIHQAQVAEISRLCQLAAISDPHDGTDECADEPSEQGPRRY